MTFSYPDPLGTLYTLLTTNWNGTEAGGTPTFGKMAEDVRVRNPYQVLIYERESEPKDIGRGSHVDWTDLATIELRVKSTSNTVYKTMCSQIWDIIAENKTAASGGYGYIRIISAKDQSYAGQNWWRMMFDVELMIYGISKTDNEVDGAGASVVSAGMIFDGGDADG